MSPHQPRRSSRLLEAETGLQALGFSEYEARIYLALLKSNPATAYELSKAAHVPRSNTYGTLESLTKKACVQPVSQQPTRYVPVEPPLVFGRIAREVSQRCKDLVQRLESVREETQTHFVWTIAGEKEVHARITEMIGGAGERIWIKATENMLETHLDDLGQAAGRGVKILIVLFGSQPERFQIDDRVKVFLHDGNGVRMGYAENMFTLTTDFTAALIAHVQSDVYGAYTQSKPIVAMAEIMIRHDVYLAEILTRFRAEIEAVFGRYLLRLRREYLSPDQFALTRSRIAAVDPEALENGPDAGPARPGTRARPRRRRPPER